MATEIDHLKDQIQRIERELEDTKRRLARIESTAANTGDERPFTQLKGILKGKAHFTEQDIENAKIKARDIS